MSEKPENPQAFPISHFDGHIGEGMTLRDYFAAKILASIMASNEWQVVIADEAETVVRCLQEAIRKARNS